jgi:hypothetical protein
MSLTKSTNGSPGDRRELAAKAISTLLSLLGAPAQGDQRTVTAAAIAVVAGYPPAVIRRLADPIAGIAATSKFFPTIAELTSWLVKANTPDEWERRRQDREYREQTAAADLARLAPPVNRSARPTLREMGEKYRNDPSPMVRYLAARWRGEQPGPMPAIGSAFVLDVYGGRAPPGTSPGSIINARGEIVGHRNADGTITYLPGGEPPPVRVRSAPDRPNNAAAKAKFTRDSFAYISRLAPSDRERLPAIRLGTPAFEAWLRYFHSIGFVPYMVWDMQHGKIDAPRVFTVPATHPGDFDLTYSD